MNVFELDADLIARYEQFARSFTMIRADDLRNQVDAIYAGGQFWPEPLIGLNPQFLPGSSIADLVANRIVDPALQDVFALIVQLEVWKFGFGIVSHSGIPT